MTAIRCPHCDRPYVHLQPGNRVTIAQDENPAYCPACDSGDATVLGILGQRVHLRCRECGIDYSHTQEA